MKSQGTVVPQAEELQPRVRACGYDTAPPAEKLAAHGLGPQPRPGPRPAQHCSRSPRQSDNWAGTVQNRANSLRVVLSFRGVDPRRLLPGRNAPEARRAEWVLSAGT